MSVNVLQYFSPTPSALPPQSSSPFERFCVIFEEDVRVLLLLLEMSGI